jgi:hypothetical protein
MMKATLASTFCAVKASNGASLYSCLSVGLKVIRVNGHGLARKVRHPSLKTYCILMLIKGLFFSRLALSCRSLYLAESTQDFHGNKRW